MIKKFWIIAAVFTLALSLTSCAKKKKEILQADYGFMQCDGTIGSFDVYLVKSKSTPGLFELSIMPVQVDAAGDIASITIASNTRAYKQLLPQVVLNNQQEIYAGILTEADLQQYDILAITPYDPSTNFADQVPAKEAFCQIPQPGDGAYPEDQTPQPN